MCQCFCLWLPSDWRVHKSASCACLQRDQKLTHTLTNTEKGTLHWHWHPGFFSASLIRFLHITLEENWDWPSSPGSPKERLCRDSRRLTVKLISRDAPRSRSHSLSSVRLEVSSDSWCLGLAEDYLSIGRKICFWCFLTDLLKLKNGGSGNTLLTVAKQCLKDSGESVVSQTSV